MARIIGKGYSFDDVLIVPKYNKVFSRQDVEFKTRITRNHYIDIPLVATNMDTVCESEMAIAIGKLGGLGILHRFLTIEEQAEEVKKVKAQGLLCAASIGIKDTEKRAEALVSSGVDILVIDIAHGHSKYAGKTLEYLKKTYPNVDVMAGNIATKDAAEYFLTKGADAVKVGIGPGSLCTTRLMAGAGIPQLTAIMDVYEATKGEIPICADGGIRKPADVCVTGDTLILTKDLRWVRADELREGDKLIGFDENYPHKKTNGKNAKRKYRSCKVTKNTKQELECVKIITDKGDVSVSVDHKLLIKTPHANKFEWKRAEDLKKKDKIIHFGNIWSEDNSRDAGYLAGIMDGEGWSVRTNQKYNGIGRGHGRLGITQSEGNTANYIESILVKLGIDMKKRFKKINNIKHKNQVYFTSDKIYDRLCILGRIRPQRLIESSEKIWKDVSVTNTNKAVIKEIKRIGVKSTYSVTTDTSTFIANGFFSHNCKAIGAGADNVMIGFVIAGTDETPGRIVETNNGKFKEYRGSASYEVSLKKKELDGEGDKEVISIEGEKTLVPYKGPVEPVIKSFLGGLSSGMTYVGAKNMRSLIGKADFIEMSNEGIKESHAHAKEK